MPRDDLAEQYARDKRAGELLALAANLACTVRDDGADAAAALIAELDRTALVELVTVLAALVPTDRTLTELLDWLGTGWNPGADTLPPWLVPFAVARGHVAFAPCGTRSAYERHVRRREEIDEACRRASNAYRRARNHAARLKAMTQKGRSAA